jgi:predicted LPLAT superfamily acyltransferase
MTSHWASLAERGACWGLCFLAGLYRVAGYRCCLAALLPIAFYFHVSGAEQRRASRQYLERVFVFRGDRRRAGPLASFMHTMEFARKGLETFATWTDRIAHAHLTMADPSELDRAAADPRGALLIISHLGNAELSRALLDEKFRSRISVLVHTHHAENYNRVLHHFRPAAAAKLIQVTGMGPETAIALRERIDGGEWIAIAGDRTPVSGDVRVSRVPFLGRQAAFPQGPYVLAHLLGCPVYLIFCLRERHGYCVYFEKFADRIELRRNGRSRTLDELAARYARRLEAFCCKAPLQWYNFFDFWRDGQCA